MQSKQKYFAYMYIDPRQCRVRERTGSHRFTSYVEEMPHRDEYEHKVNMKKASKRDILEMRMLRLQG